MKLSYNELYADIYNHKNLYKAKIIEKCLIDRTF